MLTNLINSIISPYINHPNFNYSTTTSAPQIIPAKDPFYIQKTTLIFSYTNYGVETYHSVIFDTNLADNSIQMLEHDPKIDHYKIVNHLTGEIMYEFYGICNKMFRETVDNLIKSGVKFDIYSELSGFIKKFGHDGHHQLKSGKWAR